MIDFVGLPPFMIITSRVAMKTIYFHIAKTGIYFGTLFCIHGVSKNNLAQFGTHEKLFLGDGVKGRTIN